MAFLIELLGFSYDRNIVKESYTPNSLTPISPFDIQTKYTYSAK